MRRFLRLLTLWLFALALPVQGAPAQATMAAPAPSHTMTMPDGSTMDAAAMPCHGHAVDKAGCGTCCGPIAAQQALLAVAPVATRWARLPRVAAEAAPPLFLTGGTERPPRPLPA
jgi:hypothetical protein